MVWEAACEKPYRELSFAGLGTQPAGKMGGPPSSKEFLELPTSRAVFGKTVDRQTDVPQNTRVSRLLKSCAIPPARNPMLSSSRP